MADYRIELGVKLRDGAIQNEINEAQKTLKPIELKVDAETKELTNTIREALNSLSKGTKNALTLDTSNIEASLNRLSNTITDIKTSLRTLDSKSGMKNLLSSINQIATALGKVENESDSLVKSLSALSKKDFSLNIGLDMGKKNNNMIAYGRAARKQVIPELEAQIKELETLFGGQQAAMRKLANQGKNVDFDIYTDFGDFNAESAIKKMEAMEKYINSLKKLAALDGVKLDGFNEVHRNATELIDDITGVENAVDKAGDVPEKIKKFFGSGIDAEGLSASLEPIVADLNQIREAVVNLSKGVSLEGLTSSFNRLSDSIENLLANASKIKTVLNDETLGSGIATLVASTDVSAQTRKSIAKQSNIDTGLNGLLKEFNLTGEKADIVRGKFESLAQAMARGMNEDAYEASLSDLMGTIKSLGSVSKKADADMQGVLGELKKSNMNIWSDYYKAEIGDSWGKSVSHYRPLLSKKGDGGIPVDVRYQELNALYPHLFPEEIWNQADQLQKIFDVYDDVLTRSKNRKVDVLEGYGNEDLRDYVTDIATNMREQIQAEQQLAQASTQTANTITQNVDRQSQAYEELAQKKQKLSEVDRSMAELESHMNEIESAGFDSNDDKTKYMGYWEQYNALEDESNALKAEIQQTEAALASMGQQAKQTADAVDQIDKSYEKISKDISLVRDDTNFQRVFESSNQAAQEAQRHFQELLADEKAVVSVTEQFDDNNALQSFAVNIKRASGEVETLRYAMDKLDDEENGSFRYQSGSATDRNVEKQAEARIQAANKLQIKLDEIKAGYENMGASKPIKEEAHIQSLSEQYDKVQAAIESVKEADNSTYASMVSNAEKEKSALESLVKIYRDAETFSTDLRAKDRDTAREIYSSRLDVLSSKMRKDGVYDGLSSDVDALSTKIANASDVKVLSEIANELTKLDAKYKSAKAAKDEFNRSQNVGSSVSGLRSEIEILQNASPSIKSFKTEINGAEVSIESLLKDLDQVSTAGDFKVVENKVDAFSKAAEAAGIDLNEAKTEAKKVNDAYKQMLDTQKQIRSLSIKEKNLTELGNTNELNEVSTKLKDLKADYETLKKTFGSKLTSAQFGTLQAEIDETDSELKRLDAKFADTKAKLAKQIEIDIATDKFENQVSQLHNGLNQLSDEDNKLKNLRISIEQVDDAYKRMQNATDDESRIQAQKEYAAAVAKANNELKIQTRLQNADNANKRLKESVASLEYDMLNWLKDNSKATKEYKSQIDALIDSLHRLDKADNLDQATVNGARAKFKNWTKDAELKGLTGLNFLDSMKSKLKEYSVYFGAAEMFMYAEQGLREMFNTVKEIDTAMTGLYRVTDLTASQYDTLFNDMISSAKEYGATLNDIINATTDWVRAGFDADTALGLAEVTTMYQHISDLDYDTAAENLITAYNGFKDELNGLFSGDEVAAVNYIADILNELDNNYAATSAGIGEALTRSASALDLAGNSIQETAGMITGIIEVTQDPEQAGSTLKILSLRLRGMKGALQELGEETDENVENISKMQGQILNLTGGKVNIFDGAGEFRSTYEIMKDISEVWDDLTSTAQADLLETIAGKMLARIHRNMYIEYI